MSSQVSAMISSFLFHASLVAFLFLLYMELAYDHTTRRIYILCIFQSLVFLL